ncbi:MAG: tyrosine-type recombinase/integrase [Aminipila sp.]
MLDLNIIVENYLGYCEYQKKLSDKTLKAYKIDLNQFIQCMHKNNMEVNRYNLTSFITQLHKKFKPKTAKRKIASLKAFFYYLEYEEFIDENPFNKIKVKFQEPSLLPRIISIENLQKIFKTAYQNRAENLEDKTIMRDIAVLELLFATGMRVSELCALKQDEIDFKAGTILIYGKGAKERIVHITNKNVLKAILQYNKGYRSEQKASQYLFINRLGGRLSEQSVRFMIKRYTELAGIKEKITPHMFRHTFATLLLEEDVDIRYIQQILGHSSIMTTQIYTHVTIKKQREILTTRHPRNRIRV